VVRSGVKATAKVLAHPGKLKAIARAGVGVDNIDLDAATAKGILVLNTAEASTLSTAEHALALMLSLARKIPQADAHVKSGQWKRAQYQGTQLAGKTLGVVGLGRIGAQVATVGRAFGMRVLAWSANLTAERAAEVGVEAVSFERLLAESDVVTVHQVLSDRTRGLVGARELALMKPDALLVNTSRAPIVDTEAVREALEQGRLGGVGLDVFDEEPLPVDHPLRTAPRTLLTPHVGYVTEDVYRTFFGGVVEDILAFLDGAPIREL